MEKRTSLHPNVFWFGDERRPLIKLEVGDTVSINGEKFTFRREGNRLHRTVKIGRTRIKTLKNLAEAINKVIGPGLTATVEKV